MYEAIAHTATQKVFVTGQGTTVVEELKTGAYRFVHIDLEAKVSEFTSYEREPLDRAWVRFFEELE